MALLHLSARTDWWLVPRLCSKDSQAESRLVKKCVTTAEQGLPWARGGGARGEGREGGAGVFALKDQNRVSEWQG